MIDSAVSLDERVFSPSMCSTIHGVGLALICSSRRSHMGKNTRIKKISRIAFALLALTAWMTIVAVPVGAAPWRGGGPGWHGDIGRFREHDFVVRRGGHWSHGWHGGRFGWWGVLLPRPRLPLSRSVCSSGRSRSASATGCPGAATSANLVLLRQALGL